MAGLDKLHVEEFTKSRPRHSNDNALAGSVSDLDAAAAVNAARTDLFRSIARDGATAA